LSAGFFSKDEILAQAFITPGPGFMVLGWIGIITAGLTAYYTFRVWFRVFVGPIHFKPAEDHGDHFHPHAPGWRINLVLLVLALGSIWLAAGYFFTGNLEIYLATIRFPLWLLAHVSYIFDRVIVDGLMVNGTARLAKFGGEMLRPLYNGRLQGYASTMAGGIALILAWIVWVWMRGGAS
jgi:NADH:ubiquinone oxidoreductase subunit 5 (subunit L)/multisubunit Na+/H+ antiporter MnhA subunit